MLKTLLGLLGGYWAQCASYRRRSCVTTTIANHKSIRIVKHCVTVICVIQFQLVVVNHLSVWICISGVLVWRSPASVYLCGKVWVMIKNNNKKNLSDKCWDCGWDYVCGRVLFGHRVDTYRCAVLFIQFSIYVFSGDYRINRMHLKVRIDCAK